MVWQLHQPRLTAIEDQHWRKHCSALGLLLIVAKARKHSINSALYIRLKLYVSV